MRRQDRGKRKLPTIGSEDQGDPAILASISLKSGQKYKEMVNFTETHEAHNRMMARSGQVLTLGKSVSCPQLPPGGLKNRPVLKAVQSKNSWRMTMDSLMHRMLSDIDLHTGQHRDYHVSKVKCSHDAYDWYQAVGQKQARKERKSPFFITFDSEEPPLPGSMRRYKASEFRWRDPSIEPEKKPDEHAAPPQPPPEETKEKEKEAQ